MSNGQGPVRQVLFRLRRRGSFGLRFARSLAGRRELTTARAVEAAAAIASRFRPASTLLFAGEPVPRDDLGEIAAAAGDMGLSVTVVTADASERFARTAEGLRSVVFELGPAVPGAGRSRAASEAAWAALERLRGIVPDLTAAVTVTRRTVRSLETVLERLEALPGVGVAFEAVHAGTGRFRSPAPGPRLSPGDARRFADAAAGASRARNLPAYFALAPRHAPRLDWFCGGGPGALTVDSDGRLMACGEVFGRACHRLTVFDAGPDAWAAACRRDRLRCRTGCFSAIEVQLAYGGLLYGGAAPEAPPGPGAGPGAPVG